MSSRQLKKLRAQEEQKRAALAAVADEADEASSGAEEADGLGAVVDTRPRAKNAFAAFAALGGGDDGAEGDEGDNDDDDNDDDNDDEGGHNEGGGGGVNRAPSPQQQTAKTAKPGRKKKKAKKKDKGGGKAEVVVAVVTAAAESGGGGGGAAATAGPQSVASTAGKKKAKLGAKGAKSGKPAAAVQDDDGLDEIDRALQELNMQKPATAAAAAAAAVVMLSGPDGTANEAGVRIRTDFHELRVLNELRDMFGRNTIRAARADEAHNGGPAAGPGERVDGNPGMVMVDLETFLRGTPVVVPGLGRRAGNAMLAAAAAAASQRGMTDAVARRNPFIEFKDTWPRAPSGGLGMRPVTAAAAAAAAATRPGAVVEYAFTHSAAYVQLDNTFFTLVMMHNHHPLIQFLKQNPYHIASLIQVSRVAKQDQNAALAADLCERALFSFGRATLSSFRQKLGDGLARLSFRRPENRQFLLAGYYYVKSLMPRGTHRTALAWVKLFLSVMPDDEYGLLLWGHALAVRASEEQWLVDVCGRDEDEEGDACGQAIPAIPAVRRNPMRAYVRQTLVVARLQLGDVAGAQTALKAGLARLPWLYGALFQALGLDVPRAVWGLSPRDDADALYTQLYVQQARDLWESAPVTALLQSVAAAAPRPSADHVAALPPAEPVSDSIARFAYLDGTPATMALVPGSMLHASPNYDFDPLPPPRALNVFSHIGQERPWIVAANENDDGGGGGGGGAHDWGALLDGLGFVMPPGEALDPGFGDEDELDGGGNDDDNDDDHGEDGLDQHAQTSQEQYARQRTGSMPGAWVEDVDDEEFS